MDGSRKALAGSLVLIGRMALARCNASESYEAGAVGTLRGIVVGQIAVLHVMRKRVLRANACGAGKAEAGRPDGVHFGHRRSTAGHDGPREVSLPDRDDRARVPRITGGLQRRAGGPVGPGVLDHRAAGGHSGQVVPDRPRRQPDRDPVIDSVAIVFRARFTHFRTVQAATMVRLQQCADTIQISKAPEGWTRRAGSGARRAGGGGAGESRPHGSSSGSQAVHMPATLMVPAMRGATTAERHAADVVSRQRREELRHDPRA